MSEALQLALVAGARPNFMKVAPLIHAIERHNARTAKSAARIDCCLVHTGQHYDAAMSEVFFRELGIPEPQVNLGVGSGSHAVQTANVMLGFEKVCEQQKPDWVVVFGDVNSTVACSLVAAKLGIRVAHVEAGLRSFDRTMPEEINRVVTDSIADLLLTPSEDANENLHREGVPEARIRLVGNIMIDSLIANLVQAKQSTALEKFSVTPDSFVYVTLHRPANVDHRSHLTAIADELKKLSHQLPVVFPVHPRTRKMFSEFGLDLAGHNGFRLTEPIGYHDSLWLTQNARLVLTDSGGLQEEATFFQTPCLTLRPNTERPVTIGMGSNRLTKIETLSNDLGNILAQSRRLGSIPPLWDGKTSERIVETLSNI
jgi:UDP-N-acetylglucosamine 2-epimerase (non-hydrolysing)